MRLRRDTDRPHHTARIARDRRDWNTAITAYSSRLQADPADLEALSGVGACLQMQNRHEDAIAWYDAALMRRPDDPVLHCNRALVLLTVGRYAEGWQELQWRKRLISELLPPLPFLTPDQLPALSGKRVLLHAEQGFGDTIQMLRYLPLLERHGAEIVLTVPQPLVRLVMAQPSVRQVIPHGELLPAADCQALLQDLPYLFGTTPMSIPSDIPYLVVPEALRAAWKERTAVHGGVKVGLAWACGGTDQRNRELRSLQFHDVVPLLALSGVEFYSLQIGDAALTEQQLQAYVNLHDPTPLIRDFSDTAALVMALDQVITVDTAVAHLAGALGKPVTLLLPSFREWRWVERQGHPIWYPTVTIVAIPENGWNDASGSIADACAGLLPTRADISSPEIGCRLCGGYVVPILRAGREFFICSECGLIFSECLLSLKEAEQHYQSQHEVEFDFEEYAGKILALVTPRVVLKRILDFGAGSGKLSETLRGMGFSVDSYEPMNDGDFHEECYPPGYDLIIINEVIEHCADIGKIFDLLNRLCAPGGIVYVGTLTTDGLIDDPATFRDRFAGWWYKDDPTHISFLCLKTFEYICKQPASRFHMIGYGPSGALLQKAPL